MARHERLDVNTLHVKTIKTDDFDGLGGSTLSGTEIEYLDGLTAGTVTASKAAVVDSNKDIGDFRNLDATNFDAGASGTAGSVDIFPTTASKGKFILTCTDQDGDTNVTLKPAAMGQASVISIPDPGAATANILLTDAANDGVVVTATAAEINKVDPSVQGIGTPGTGVTADEACVGDIHVTTLTISQADAFTVADNAALADGHTIYTFPAGQILLLGASLTDVLVTLAEDSANAAAELGLGTLEGTGANATLGAVGAGAENIAGPITTANMDGTANSVVAGLAAPLAIADGDSHVVWANIASTWADTAGVDLTGDLAGEVTLVWVHMGNPA